MRFAQILNQKVHWIFEAEEMPNFPPTPTGESINIVDISTNTDIREGWNYNSNTSEFTEPVYDYQVNPIITEPTDSELIQAEMLLTQQQIVSKQEAIDETLAALLLAQQK